jgi:hypothetical protein
MFFGLGWYAEQERLRVRLDRLFYFHEVVERGSMLAAGAALDRHQGTVSRTIQKIEAEWGCRLFRRNSRRGSILTPEGKRLYEFTRPAIAILRTLNAQAIERGGVVRKRRGPKPKAKLKPRAAAQVPGQRPLELQENSE